MRAATDVLRREHHTIQVMTTVLEEMLARYSAGAEPPSRELSDTANFFLRFADNLHHAKEELILFPAMVRHDPEVIPILDLLLEDHQHARALLHTIDAALQHGERATYLDALRNYVTFIRLHIERENTGAFVTADALFSEEEQRELAVQLATVQEERLPSPEEAQLNTFREDIEQRYIRP